VEINIGEIIQIGLSYDDNDVTVKIWYFMSIYNIKKKLDLTWILSQDVFQSGYCEDLDILCHIAKKSENVL